MDEQVWEYCRIERVTRRVRWWSRQGEGIFAAVMRGQPIARSASFPLPDATDADIAAFHGLRAQLGEEGWEGWQRPRVRPGLAIFAVGYWHHTLRRRAVGPGPELPGSLDAATRRIDLPPPTSMPTGTLPPGVPIRRDCGGTPSPIDDLPPEVLPPGTPVRRRGGHRPPSRPDRRRKGRGW